jgi:hypothetical protein
LKFASIENSFGRYLEIAAIRKKSEIFIPILQLKKTPPLEIQIFENLVFSFSN